MTHHVEEKEVVTQEPSLRFMVIGNGMAGVAAVEEVLKIRRDLTITIFGDEPHVNYNRILLSDVLAGKRSEENVYLNSRSWYAEHQIDLRIGKRVTAIDPVRRTVTDGDGEETAYDRLLLAVGAVPFIPRITGVDKAGVFVFRTIEDTKAMMAWTGQTKQAVVIGGGLLGLEAARGLANRGVSVTVLHLVDRLMEQQLDTLGAAMLKREIERLGISLRLNTTATGILGAKQVEGVQLTAGDVLPAGMVVICTGVRPDTVLAKAAGLQINRGILVDDRLQTSEPSIFALGDAIEHRGRTYGLVGPLRDQARVVAESMVSHGALRYEGTVCATTLKVAGVNLTSAGNFFGGPGYEEASFVDTQVGVYRKLVLEGNRLVGMILLGDNRDGAMLFTMIRSGSDVSKIKDRLLGGPAVEDGVPVFSVLSTMPDSETVCTCHTVTKGSIVAAICEKGLTTREDVAACTKASTGCGSCAQMVQDLLREVQRQKLSALPALAAAAPATRPVVASPVPPLAEKVVLGYPAVYPKSLDVERIKQEGLGLDFDQIRDKGVMALSQDDYYRLKTYGVCSQKHPGYFMMRIRIPGGRVTSQQLENLADLAETHGRGWGHLTTRQDFELHWVRVEEVPDIFEKLEGVGLSTRSACGHTLRNVMACPHGAISPNALLDAQPWAAAVTDYFVRRSDWINPTMPNRLNIYFAGCPDCAPHAQINDIGFVAVRRPEQDGVSGAVGFELWAGGSLGAHPMLGFKLKEFIELEEALPACQSIFHIHTKYGNRNKAKSRLKFLIEQWGQDKFAAVFEQVFQDKRSLPENREFRLPLPEDGETVPSALKQWRTKVSARLRDTLPSGCTLQRQPGYTRITVDVPLGEIRAEQLRMLGRVCRRHGNGEVHFTAEQDVELRWMPMHRLRNAIRLVQQAGLSLKGQKAGLQVVACPGTEFCVLAVTNAQGAAREILDRMTPKDPATAAFARGVTVSISGCPNSCAKHQIADIGLAGGMIPVGDERRFSYSLYLGGRKASGIRLGEVVRKGITEQMVTPTVEALLEVVMTHREPGESFQMVVDRIGLGRIGELLEERLTPLVPQPVERITMVLDLDLVEA